MSIKRFEHGGNIYSALRETGQKPVLDFSANINPLGLSPQVRRAIAENIDKVVHYPDATAHALRAAICSYYGVREEMLVLGNGATELLYLLCHVLRPDKVLLSVPCFSEYERAAVCVAAQIEYFYLDSQKDFLLNYDELAQAVQENTLVFLGHPNNPTGKLLAEQGFEQFVQKLQEKNSRLVLDESFIDFLPDGEMLSLRSYCTQHDNLYVLHSLTKFFAIPGLRLGFGVFPGWLAEKLGQATDCWNVNNLAQAAGCAAVQDAGYIKKSKQETKKLREQLVSMLKGFPHIKVFASAVNFLLLDLGKTKMTAEEFCQSMAVYGILVRNCANYPGLDGSYVRIAVRTAEENDKFIEILHKVMGG